MCTHYGLFRMVFSCSNNCHTPSSTFRHISLRSQLTLSALIGATGPSRLSSTHTHVRRYAEHLVRNRPCIPALSDAVLVTRLPVFGCQSTVHGRKGVDPGLHAEVCLLGIASTPSLASMVETRCLRRSSSVCAGATLSTLCHPLASIRYNMKNSTANGAICGIENVASYIEAKLQPKERRKTKSAWLTAPRQSK